MAPSTAGDLADAGRLVSRDRVAEPAGARWSPARPG